MRWVVREIEWFEVFDAVLVDNAADVLRVISED